MDKSASESDSPTLCRLLFAIVAKWSINAHLGKWWEENNDDFLLANVSTHVRKEGKKLGKKQVEGIWYHGIQRTFDFYAVVSNACKYDRSSRRKKNLFSFFFHPYFSSVKERCQYSTCIQFPGSNVPIRARKRFCQESKKVTQVSWSGHVRDFLLSSKTKDFGLQSEHLFYFFPPEEAGGVALTFIAFLLIEQDPLA